MSKASNDVAAIFAIEAEARAAQRARDAAIVREHRDRQGPSVLAVAAWDALEAAAVAIETQGEA